MCALGRLPGAGSGELLPLLGEREPAGGAWHDGCTHVAQRTD